MQYAWTCKCCGKQFSTLPMDYGCEAPDYWFGLPEFERSARSKLDSEFCSIDDRDYFIRGCLEIPVLGLDDVFVWGVWSSLSHEGFKRALDLRDEDPVADEPSRFGWLSNNLKLYPSTLNLKAHVHFRGGKTRPLIALEPTDHPLAVEQRNGITIERVQEIAAAMTSRH